MATFILLPAEQVEEVRGQSVTAGSALNPIERAGGVFILNAVVLTDPAHIAHRAYLSALPQIDDSDQKFPPTIVSSAAEGV